MYTNWTELETACKACEKCELCQTRTHVVFGMGNPQSDILFIGEGPEKMRIWKASLLLAEADSFWIKCLLQLI